MQALAKYKVKFYNDVTHDCHTVYKLHATYAVNSVNSEEHR